MGWLERMDRRNQVIVEEQARSSSTGRQVASNLALAAALYTVGTLLAWVLPWSPSTVRLGLAATACVLVAGRLVIARWLRRRRARAAPDASSDPDRRARPDVRPQPPPG